MKDFVVLSKTVTKATTWLMRNSDSDQPGYPPNLIRVYAVFASIELAAKTLLLIGERGGLVVNASDSGSRGRGFEPHSGQTVLCP